MSNIWVDIDGLVSRIITLFSRLKIHTQCIFITLIQCLCMKIFCKCKTFPRSNLIRLLDPGEIIHLFLCFTTSQCQSQLQHRLLCWLIQGSPQFQRNLPILFFDFSFCVSICSIQWINFIADLTDLISILCDLSLKRSIALQRSDRITHGSDIHLVYIPGQKIDLLTTHGKRNYRECRLAHCHNLIVRPTVHHIITYQQCSGKKYRQHDSLYYSFYHYLFSLKSRRQCLSFSMIPF